MPLRYSSRNLGTMTIVQKRGDEEKPREFKLQIREGNCLAVFMNIYKEKEPKDPKLPWVHQLVAFFADERHLKNIVQSYDKEAFACFFNAVKIKNVKLNLFFKESKTLLKYMIRDGLKVECYYKEEKSVSWGDD